MDKVVIDRTNDPLYDMPTSEIERINTLYMNAEHNGYRLKKVVLPELNYKRLEIELAGSKGLDFKCDYKGIKVCGVEIEKGTFVLCEVMIEKD